MLDFIINTDTWFFYLLNKEIANPVFDAIFPFITDIKNWYLLYLIAFGWLLFKGGKEGRICAGMLVVTIIISDQISSHLVKELVGRPRPCHTLLDIRLLVGCGGGKSFPSSHAVNNFAAAVICSYFYRKNIRLFVTAAALMAFSRVYVGVHYPLDIYVGSFVGVAVSALIIIAYEKLIKKYIYSWE